MVINKKCRKRLIFEKALQAPPALFSKEIYDYRKQHRK